MSSMREPSILYDFRDTSDGGLASLQQIFREPANLRRHFHERIFLCIAAIVGKQLELGAAEITISQVVFDEGAICVGC